MASLHLGDTAPDFTADTSEGEISFLDWKGDSWAIFFSHPNDFTPVCTTELGYTAKLKADFDRRGVKAIALSVDSVKDHVAWSQDIAETQGTPVNFPMIGDPERKVADLYDMIHPGEGDTSTVRSVFIIDPSNKVRLTLTYPKSVGRNFDELLRDNGAPVLAGTVTVTVPFYTGIMAPPHDAADRKKGGANADLAGHGWRGIHRRELRAHGLVLIGCFVQRINGKTFTCNSGNVLCRNRVAFKHAHSQQNPEKDWGNNTLQAVEFALDARGLFSTGIGTPVPGPDTPSTAPV